MAQTSAPGPSPPDATAKAPPAQRLKLGWTRLRSAKKDIKPPGEWEAKGDELVKVGKPADALECYTKGISEDQSNLELWMKKTDTFLGLKRYRSALFCTDSALAKDGSRPDIWLMRGLLLHAAGDNDTAIETVNYSLSLKGDIIEGWALKAESLMDLGKFEEARACLQLAEDIDPKSPEYILLTTELARRIDEKKKCPMCSAKVEKTGQACQKCTVEVLMEDAQISVQRAKDANKGVAEAEELLASAKSFRDRGFWSQAEKVSNPLPSLLGPDWQSGAFALQIIDEAEDVSEALESDNMIGTVSIREKTERVREALKDGQTVRSVVLARQALELAKKIAQKYSTMLLKEKEKRKVKPTTGPVCPKCGESVDAEWVKCPVCKGMLKEEPGKSASPAPGKPATTHPTPGTPGELAVTDGGALFCPACHEEVEDFWMKCLFCGAKLMGLGDKR